MSRRLTRRTVLVAGVVVLSGCGARPGGTGGTDGSGTTAAGENPARGDAIQMGELSLGSPAFEDGEPIPRRYGAGEANVNPPLAIGGVPGGARSLVLVVDDPDAVEPAGKVWVHWLVWNVDPGRTEIPEEWNAAGAVEGTNSSGDVGYGGPAPPDREHTYRFKLYALDTTLSLDRGAKRPALGEAMRDHVLARTQLEGTYAP